MVLQFEQDVAKHLAIAAAELVVRHYLSVCIRNKQLRPAFTYEKSLKVLTMAKADGLVTKSNLILGMGEEPEEIEQATQAQVGNLP